MKNEQSLLLQKKMILILSLIIMTVFGGIYYKNYNFEKEETFEIAGLNLDIDVITVVKDDEEDEVKKVQVNYLMAKIAKETADEDPVYEEISVSGDDEAEPEKEEKVNEDIAKSEPQGKFEGDYKEVIEVTATAYCLCQKCCGKTPDDKWYGYTNSGLKIVPGSNMKVIAVDPSVIPLNSHVYVEGVNGAKDYGYAIAADTGSAIKQNKIDLYMDSHQDALNWGRRTMKVYILNEE